MHALLSRVPFALAGLSCFVSGPKFTALFSSNVGKIVVDNAVFSLSIA